MCSRSRLFDILSFLVALVENENQPESVGDRNVPFKPSCLTVHFSPPVTLVISVVFALSRWYWLRCQVQWSCKNSVPSLIIEESWLSWQLPPSLSFHPPVPGELFDLTRPADGSPQSRRHLEGLFLFFFYDSADTAFLPFHVTLFF